MVTRRQLWPIFMLLMISSACQQRYAHIPKVKVKLEHHATENANIQLPELAPIQASVPFTEPHYNASPIQSNTADSALPQVPNQKATEVTSEPHSQNLSLDSLQEIEKPTPSREERIRYQDLGFQDQFMLFALLSTALLLSLVVLTAIGGIAYWILVFFVETLSFSGLLTIISLGSLTIIFTLYFIGSWLIKDFLGGQVQPDVIYFNYLILLVLLLVLGILNLYVAGIFLLALLVIGLIALLKGSQYARDREREESE